MPRKSKAKKEEICEEVCFHCKDGGLLMVCDYKSVSYSLYIFFLKFHTFSFLLVFWLKPTVFSCFRNCLKAYHPECVEKDESFVESGQRWNCSKLLLLMFLCHFQCFICLFDMFLSLKCYPFYALLT